jgi:hypothetical protein
MKARISIEVTDEWVQNAIQAFDMAQAHENTVAIDLGLKRANASYGIMAEGMRLVDATMRDRPEPPPTPRS